MTIKSEIIADSVNMSGNRLTTFLLEYPRYIHSELLTHRVFSKNAASSRAIPVEKFIQQVIENPATPSHWGRNQSGMQANEELLPDEIEQCKREWLSLRDKAIESVLKLKDIGLHKQVANRLLEPWFHMKIILSGTEFQNFFALRAHKDAHPDLQKLAFMMLDQYNNFKPSEKKTGEWHIPFGDKIDQAKLDILEEKIYGPRQPQTYYFYQQQELRKKIAVARCARVSYLNYEGKDDYEVDVQLCDRLFGNNPKHLSPAEHVAQALDNSEYSGNFRGWKQYRKFFKDENLSDERVVR